MTDAELDRCYTALCHALGEAGEARAPLLLSMLSLALLARTERAEDVLPVIEEVRRKLAQEGPG